MNDLVDHKISLQNLIRTISDSQKEKKNPCPFYNLYSQVKYPTPEEF